RGGALGAVDADARADLRVVLDDDGADLRDLRVLLAVPAVAEAVGADDGAGVDDDAVAEGDALAEDDLWEELAVVADGHVGADVNAGVERDVVSDAAVVADEDAGADAGVVADAGAGRDVSEMMPADGRARDRRGEA